MRALCEGRWVLAMADPAMARALSDQLPCDLNIAITHDGLSAYNAVVSVMPDILIADLTLPHWDGFELIRRVRASKLFTLPHALLLGLPGMERFTAQARGIGAEDLMIKPVTGTRLMAWSGGLTPFDRLPVEAVSEQKILRKLWALGFSARMQGTKYLSMAVDLASRDVRLNKLLTKSLYPLVAERFGVSEQQVEHAMRRAIESAWSAGSLDEQYKLFGNTIDARRAKPTAGEMIACLAEKLRTGLEMDE